LCGRWQKIVYEQIQPPTAKNAKRFNSAIQRHLTHLAHNGHTMFLSSFEVANLFFDFFAIFCETAAVMEA
jgi:hypothetical protein